MSSTITDVFRISSIYSASSTQSQRQRVTREEEEKDIMTLSNQAKEFNTIFKTICATPDIREDKVQDIESRMSFGNYEVSSSDLANKILENI